ncbi:MAG: PD40 domain-containing protein [Bacteroidetes bacterium]|nr:PD40 domain-containing protein [Bacteroidota bacterium]
MRKLLLTTLIVCAHLLIYSQSNTRILEFETSEVTQPALTMMPDGKTFVFNLLGHLFQMPVAGGDAVQLTFGPYYDSEPVAAPDGKQIAFISNRDGSDGNIFILDVQTKKITQVTQEFMVGSPSWSPDGKSIAFLSFLKREEYPVDKVPFFGAGDMTLVKAISAAGKNLQQVTDAGSYVLPFYQKDGVLTWGITVRKSPSQYAGPGAPPPSVNTFFESKSIDGKTVRIGSLKSRTGRIAFAKQNQSFYYVNDGQLMRYSVGDTLSKIIAPFKGSAIALALAPDEKTIYAAADAKLWKVNLDGTGVEKMNWKAKVKMEVVKPALRKWTAPPSGNFAPSVVMSPRLSPDGKIIIFGAAGFLWEQPAVGGSAKKLIEENSSQLDPAFSPDGKQIAFVSDIQGKRELRIFDIATQKTKSLATVGGYSWILHPTWSPDGKTILYQQSDALGAPYKFITVNADTGADAVTITKTGNSWNGRPHFSTDGNYIYYTSRQDMFANVFKRSLQADAKPEAVTNLKRHVHDGLVSPNGKWVAFRRNAEIWIAAMKDLPLHDEDFKLFSKTGGRSFAFTTDGLSIIYSDGAKVVKQQIANNVVTAFPVMVTLSKPSSTPVLVSGVRVLNFKTNSFSNPTAIYIENNRIAWIGDENTKKIAPNTMRINGEGKYAMPGIMDSHTHSAWTNQQITEDRLIAYGVTSIRDVGSRLDKINTLRDKGNSTMLPVPRYFASGDIYEGLVPLWGDAFFEINSKQEAKEYVSYSKANGASFIKVYASLPWFIKSEVAAEANRQGMPVVGHGISLEEIVRSINFGITSLEHGGPNNDDIVKLMVAADTWLDPTPGIFGAGSTLKLGDSTNLDKKFRTFVPEEELKAARPGRTPSAGQLAAWKNTLANLKRVHDSGVSMLDGTDALMTGVFHGPSVHWVLSFFSDAGIPNIDVLKIGTIKAAESVGAANDLGSVEPGKLADLILLDADPLQNINNTLKIWRVVKDGVVFDPATMRGE